MSDYGFRFRGANGEVTISRNARNLVFVGKAVYSTVNNATSDYYQEITGKAGLSTPALREYIFFFDAPNDEQICPAIYAVGYCCLGVCTRVSEKRWRIAVFAQSSRPEIYVFAPIREKVGGWGMALYQPDGTLAFCSGAPHMIPRDVVSLQTSGPGIRRYDYGGNIFYLYYPVQTIWRAGIQPINKPLLIFDAGDNSFATSEANYYTAFFARCIRYNQNELQARWGRSWSSAATYKNFSAASHRIDVIVLSGTDYD